MDPVPEKKPSIVNQLMLAHQENKKIQKFIEPLQTFRDEVLFKHIENNFAGFEKEKKIFVEKLFTRKDFTDPEKKVILKTIENMTSAYFETKSLMHEQRSISNEIEKTEDAKKKNELVEKYNTLAKQESKVFESLILKNDYREKVNLHEEIFKRVLDEERKIKAGIISKSEKVSSLYLA